MADFSFQGFEPRSQHWVHWTTQEGLRAYTLTGIAITNAVGTGKDWKRGEVQFDVPIPDLPVNKGLQIVQWAPFATLNAIANEDLASWAGWAVDYFDLNFIKSTPMRQVAVQCGLAVRDNDGLLLRVGYAVHLLGSIADVRPPK